MSWFALEIHSVLMIFVMAVLMFSLALAVVRLVLGPSVPDRVVALDLISILVVGIIAVYALVTDKAEFLDAAIVLALISFLGTVAFAYYVEREPIK